MPLNEKKYILHLTKQRTGGAGEYAYRLSEELNKSGKFISTCYSSTDFMVNKAHHRYFFSKLVRLLINKNSNGVIHSHIAEPMLGLSNAIAKADIIHLHSINNWLDLTLLLKIIKNKKTVWTTHGIWNLTGGCVINHDCFNYNSNCTDCPFFTKRGLLMEKIPQLLLRQKKEFINRIDYLIPNSLWTKAIITNSYAREKCAKNIVYPIVSEAFFPISSTKREDHRPKYIIGLSANNLTDENKNIGKLLQHINDANDPFFDDVVFLLAGDGQVSIKNKNINIIYIGMQTKQVQMNQFYNSLDLFVSPSLSETFGMTIVEAQFCGIPVVTFDKGALSETFQHKKTGYLVLEEDYLQFIEAMKWCLTNLTKDKELISSYSKNHFCKNKIIEKQEEIYNSLF